VRLHIPESDRLGDFLAEVVGEILRSYELLLLGESYAGTLQIEIVKIHRELRRIARFTDLWLYF
jgi:hypothetical protein